MIDPASFYEALRGEGFSYFTGVPDSLLRQLCAYITDHAPVDHHVIAANEGAAVALAAGYHLATSGYPVVYLQNSGLGHTVNPQLSLADPAVYAIPILFIVGWRGEPGVADEPQHVAQGRATVDLIGAIGLGHDVIDRHTTDLPGILERARRRMADTRGSHVLLVRHDTFQPYAPQSEAPLRYSMTREQALETLLPVIEPGDAVVATTGMTSRELFELREREQLRHDQDFLTVGAMGHCSQIALGIAQHQRSRQVFCLDGDGAVIMHMGSLAVVGAQRPDNFKHIVINNGAHDSVGGQPTAGFHIDICGVALACAYRSAVRVEAVEDVAGAVGRLRASRGPALVEIRVNRGARPNLGRPTTSPLENKARFMKHLGHGTR